jgi:hypothetical protein
MTWEEYWQSLPGEERGTAGSGAPDPYMTYQPIEGEEMLGQDDQIYWEVDYQAPAVDDQAYWDAYYAALAAPVTYQESLEWGLPSLAITPEEALAESEEALQQAIADLQATGQPAMTEAETVAFLDKYVTTIPSSGTGFFDKLKNFASGLTVGGGPSGSSGSAGGGGGLATLASSAAKPATSDNSTMLLIAGIGIAALVIMSGKRG